MEVDKDSSSSVSNPKVDQSPAKEEEPEADEQTRLWATVKENPSDFTSWTNLLQLVEQKVRTHSLCLRGDPVPTTL